MKNNKKNNNPVEFIFESPGLCRAVINDRLEMVVFETDRGWMWTIRRQHRFGGVSFNYGTCYGVSNVNGSPIDWTKSPLEILALSKVNLAAPLFRLARYLHSLNEPILARN